MKRDLFLMAAYTINSKLVYAFEVKHGLKDGMTKKPIYKTSQGQQLVGIENYVLHNEDTRNRPPSSTVGDNKKIVR
jgi:hypothetical protein